MQRVVIIKKKINGNKGIMTNHTNYYQNIDYLSFHHLLSIHLKSIFHSVNLLKIYILIWSKLLSFSVHHLEDAYKLVSTSFLIKSILKLSLNQCFAAEQLQHGRLAHLFSFQRKNIHILILLYSNKLLKIGCSVCCLLRMINFLFKNQS